MGNSEMVVVVENGGMGPQTEAKVEAQVEKQGKGKAKGGKAKAKEAATLDAFLTFEAGVARINVAKIASNPNENFTRPEGTGDIEELAAKILRDGQETPIWVARDASLDGYFRVRAGFRRVAAVRLLVERGLHDGEMDAKVLTDNGQRTALLANVAENENGKVDITPLGRMVSYAALQEQGFNYGQIAALTGRAQDFVRDHLRLPNAAPECIEALKADPESDQYVPWSVVRLVIRRKKSEQPEVLDKVRGLSTVKAAALIAKLDEKVEEPVEGEEGEGGGEGEGEGEGEKQDKLAAYKLNVAQKLLPVFDALLEAARQLDERLAALEDIVEDEREDFDGAVALQRLIRKAANAGADKLVALVGEEAYNAAQAAQDEKSAQ